jgi:hypothetical protein
MDRCTTPCLGAIFVTIGVLFSVGVAPVASDDAPQSRTAAGRLTALLTTRTLEAVAAPDPSEPGRFVAALYLPESQLLAIAATLSPSTSSGRTAGRRRCTTATGDDRG